MAPTKTAKKPPAVVKAASPTNAAAAKKTTTPAAHAGAASGGGVELNNAEQRVQNETTQRGLAAGAKPGTAIKHPAGGSVRKGAAPTSAVTGIKAPVSSSGAADISNGQLSTLATDINALQKNDPTTSQVAAAGATQYAAGESAQSAADAAASAASAGTTSGTGSASTTATTAAPSLLSKIAGFFSTTTGKVVIVGGIGVAGFVVYRRMKSRSSGGSF